MAELLTNWLHDVAKVTSRVTVLDRDLSNGYIFGEVLAHFGQQPDFSSFSTYNTPDAKINNFSKLEPTLRRLKVKFDAKVANSIMSEQRGSAGLLLVQIKHALENIEKPLKVPGAVGATISKRTGTLTLPALRTTHPKEIYEELEHKLFDARIRSMSENQNDVKLSLHLQKFSEEMLRQQDLVAILEREDARRRAESKTDERIRMLEKLQDNLREKREWEDKGFNEHSVNMTRKHDMEKAALRLELAMNEKTRRKKEGDTLYATQDMQEGIQQFEKTMQRLAAEGVTKLETRDEKLIDSETALEHLEALKATLPDPAVLQQAASQHLAEIKERRREELAARKEREKRRRRVMLEQQQAQQEVEDRRRGEMLVEKLLKQSEEERQIAARLWQARYEKDVAKENRIYREKQYESRRQKDREEAILREAELAAKAKEEYAHQLEINKKIVQENRDERARMRYQRHFSGCQDIVHQIVELSYRTCEYRRHADSTLVPPQVWREWMALFLAGELVPKQRSESPQYDPTSVADSSSSADILDTAMVIEYQSGDGMWHDGEPDEQNEELGIVIQTVTELTAPKKDIQLVATRDFPIKACFVGRTYSGKSSAAAKVAKKFGAAVFSTEQLVKEALIAAEQGDLEPLPSLPPPVSYTSENPSQQQDPIPESATRKLTNLALLGLQLQKTLTEGGEIPDATLVQLVVEAIRKEEKSVNTGGWILDNFPRTVQQAAMLEKELSGTTPPELLAAEEPPASRKKKQPKLAPPPPEPPKPSGPRKSAIDIVLRFDVDTETASRRALGRRLDPKKGIVYHLEYDPPPPNEAIWERLTSVESNDHNEEQLHHRMTTYDEHESKLVEWFALYDTLYTVDASLSVPELYAIVEEKLGQVISMKEQAREEEERLRKEQEELERRQAEEAAASKLAEEEARKQAEAEAAARGAEQAASEEEARALSAEQGKGRAGKKGTPAKGGAAQGKKDAKTPATQQAGRPKTGSTADVTPSATSSAPTLPMLNADGTLVLPPPPPVPAPVVPVGPRTIDVPLAQVLKTAIDSIEAQYYTGLKQVFQALRRERARVMRHFTNARKDFLVHISRPDTRQELVDLFQAQFNALEVDLRSDLDMKNELHQRTEDLRDALWETADRRKNEDETELRDIVEDSWLMDNVEMLNSLFVMLVQLEVDRDHGIRLVLRDYYDRLENKVEQLQPEPQPGALPPDARDFSVAEGTFAIKYKSPLAGKFGFKKAKTLKGSRDVSSTQLIDSSKQGGTKLGAPKDKGMKNRPSSSQQMLEDQTDDPLSRFSRSLNYALSLVPEPAPTDGKPPSPEANTKKKKDKASEEKDRLVNAAEATPPEVSAVDLFLVEVQSRRKRAVELEDKVLLRRLRRLGARCPAIVMELKQQEDALQQKLETVIAARYRGQLTIVSTLAKTIKTAIEAEAPLTARLLIEGDQVVLDESAFPPIPDTEASNPDPEETPVPGRFTCRQLLNMCHHLRSIAPTGIITAEDLCDVFMHLTGTSYGGNVLPPEWQVSDPSNFERISKVFNSTGLGLIDWRELLVAASFPGIPTADDILALKEACSIWDTRRRGKLLFSQYVSIPFWFQEATEGLSSDSFDRGTKLKEVYFEMLYQGQAKEKEVDYLSLILYLCYDPNPKQGIRKAMLAASNSDDNSLTPEVIYRVFHHGVIRRAASHPFAVSSDPYTMDKINEIFRDYHSEAGITQTKDALTYEEIFRTDTGRLLLDSCDIFRLKHIDV